MGQTPTTVILQIGELDKNQNSYPLRLFVAGKKKELATEWITSDELDRTKLQFGDPVTTFLTEVDADPVFQTIGKYLYTLLYRGSIKDQWDKLSAKPEGVRLELEIIPKDVAAFPWALLNDGLAQLALPDNRFTRKFTPAKLKPLPPDTGPLRVLIVIGAKDEDADVLPLSEVRHVETEIRKRNRFQADNLLAHRMIDIKVVPRPTIEKLQGEYKDFKPHIFHFIGHGELIGNDGCLVINVFDEKAQKYAPPVKWTAAQIFANFQTWRWLPRLVFINACRSDAQNSTTEDIRMQAWSIGDVFRRLSVPAVLSMQADIKGDLAGTFAGIVYKGLAELKPLDEAPGGPTCRCSAA